MIASFDLAQRQHASNMDKRTAARPASRRVIDVSGDGLASEVQMTIFTCECPELAVISVGSPSITDEFAETSSCKQERIIPVAHKVSDLGWRYVQDSSHALRELVAIRMTRAKNV